MVRWHGVHVGWDGLELDGMRNGMGVRVGMEWDGKWDLMRYLAVMGSGIGFQSVE